MASAPRRGRILLVEDEADLRETLAELLQAEGYRVDTATNGREALDRLQEADLPGLIILDLMMPVMTGWKFLEEQQQDPLLAHVPVVVLTAVANLPGMQVPGAVACFRKPVDLAAFLSTLGRYLG